MTVPPFYTEVARPNDFSLTLGRYTSPTLPPNYYMGRGEWVYGYILTSAWLTSIPAAASKARTISVLPLIDATSKAVQPDCCREQPNVG